MDGVDGRYQDSRTSSPEESLGGSYIKVVLRNGRQYVCEIHEGNAEDLERCMNCGFYTATLVRLVCKDILCEGCFRESRVYVCPAHSIRTETYQAKAGSLWHNLKCNSISIKCPTCGSMLGLRSIQEHIEKCHPESGARSTGLQNAEQDKTELSSSRGSLKCNAQSSGDCDSAVFNVGQSRPPRQVSGTEMDIREPGRNKVNHNYNLRSSQAKDPEPPIPEKSEPQPVYNAKLDQTERRCNEAPVGRTHSSPCERGLETNPKLSEPVHCAEGVNTVKTGPWNMKALGDPSHDSPKSRDPEYGNPEKLKSSECIASAEKEHVETCYNGIVACRKCKVRVHFSDFEQHTQLCKVEDSKKSTPTSEVKQEEDDRREEKELDNNIQELKDKIKVLEKRLEDIEKPLLKILERLRRGS